MIPAWILERPGLVVGAVLCAAVAATGITQWIRAERAEARADKAEAQAAQWRASHDALRAATDEQARAVRALVAESAERSDRAAKAMTRAATLAASLQGRVDAILGTKPPDGMDPCVAAQQAFAAELRLERQQ